LRRHEILLPPDARWFEDALQKLQEMVPVQHITGETEFYGLPLKTGPPALIPRPETEELVKWILDEHAGRSPRILDVGTGSGCIALALAANLPDATVFATDIRKEALALARGNARMLGLKVKFILHDILADSGQDIRDTQHRGDSQHKGDSQHGEDSQHRGDSQHGSHIRHTRKRAETARGNTPDEFLPPGIPPLDIIVSNPPYIPLKEKETLPANVRDSDPPQALFVPDEDPLIFYRHIARTGRYVLVPGGSLYFEIHERFGREIRELAGNEGYPSTELRQDINGKDRMVKAVREK
jgi:release factor glutamine methyltransferase